MNCCICKFWESHSEASDSTKKQHQRGDCKRFPPVLDPLAIEKRDETFLREQPVRATSTVFWIVPVVFGDDWCGEFKRLYKQ